MAKLFFIPDLKTPEITEIISLLEQNNVNYVFLKCKSDEVGAFVERLKKEVEAGNQPIMLGESCSLIYKENKLMTIKLRVPEGVEVLTNTVKASWLKQVAKLLDVDLLPMQKLKGYFTTWSFAQLRAKGFSSEDIRSLVKEQFLAEGGTEAELIQTEADVAKLERLKMLVCANVENRKRLGPTKFFVEEYCFADRIDIAVLVSFRDGTLPVYFGKSSVVRSLAKRFEGEIKDGFFFLQKEEQKKSFMSAVKKMYR